jgi:drug/metabolite transporter superfamily protein YnfA
VTRNLALCALAAVLEIAGCYAFWVWLRRGASFGIAAVGLVSLQFQEHLVVEDDAPTKPETRMNARFAPALVG